MWRGRHRAILLVLWLHVPALAVLALATGESMDVASGVLVVATSAALATAPWGGRRWRSALATVGLLSASCVLVSMGGGTVELAFHFFVTIALVMLYQDGFPFLIAVGFVAVYALVSAAMESLGVWPPAETWSNPWLRAAVGELLILATATANLANWRLNEDSRAEAERSFRQLYEGQKAVVRELQQSQRLKDELYNVVSHELRTPLTGILGFGELLLTRDDRITPDQRKEHLGRILREARRLQRVVDNLVYSSKVIQQDGSAAADLRGVVGAVIEDLDDVPGRERLDLQVDLAAAREVAMPAEALRLVMVNLLGNALKYATPLTTVRVAARAAGPSLLAVSVSNAGPTITPADRERMFEPFVQLDSSLTRSASGVGLGLHIVRRLVESYGGTAAVDSVDGLITFTVAVPTVVPITDEDAPARSRRPSAPGISRTADRPIHRPALPSGPGLSYHRSQRRRQEERPAGRGALRARGRCLGPVRLGLGCHPARPARPDHGPGPARPGDRRRALGAGRAQRAHGGLAPRLPAARDRRAAALAGPGLPGRAAGALVRAGRDPPGVLRAAAGAVPADLPPPAPVLGHPGVDRPQRRGRLAGGAGLGPAAVGEPRGHRQRPALGGVRQPVRALDHPDHRAELRAPGADRAAGGDPRRAGRGRAGGRPAGRGQRLARDIHDTLAQGFVSIVLQLQAAEAELPEGPTKPAATWSGPAGRPGTTWPRPGGWSGTCGRRCCRRRRWARRWAGWRAGWPRRPGWWRPPP